MIPAVPKLREPSRWSKKETDLSLVENERTLTYKHSIISFIFLNIEHLLILTSEKSCVFILTTFGGQKWVFSRSLNRLKPGG